MSYDVANAFPPPPVGENAAIPHVATSMADTSDADQFEQAGFTLAQRGLQRGRAPLGHQADTETRGPMDFAFSSILPKVSEVSSDIVPFRLSLSPS